MIRIAIVEDDVASQNKLVSYIDRYYNSDKSRYSISLFDKCEPFVYNYKPEYDIAFMDIGLPGISGMEAAAAIRKVDPIVVIIFVTSLAQYAVKGYQVSAFDFVVKPVGYVEFEMKFRRAELTVISRKDCEIVVTERACVSRVPSNDVIYVEVSGHYLYYHTVNEVLKGYGTMTNIEKELCGKNFMRCNNCYLVNPHFIHRVSGNTVYLKNGEELNISRQRKKQFMSELTVWLGEGRNI